MLGDVSAWNRVAPRRAELAGLFADEVLAFLDRVAPSAVPANPRG
jgi:hypothetical protein